MQRVRCLDDLRNFLSVVIVSAPDKFRRFDFLPEEDQLNLGKAFAELNNGMALVERKIGDNSMLKQSGELLSESLAAYECGDIIRGAHLLQDFEELIFPN
jgi:hypothetical protein